LRGVQRPHARRTAQRDNLLRSSRRRGRSSSPIAVASTGSTHTKPRCRRRASFGSTTTNTR
jgi:hypothetical protein